MARDFWTSYGKKSIVLMVVGVVLLATMGWPKLVSRPMPIDPTPYRKAITDLESVLFYAGATDPESHHKLTLTLMEAVAAEVRSHPPDDRADDLIGALEGMMTSVRKTEAAAFRLAAPRQAWVQMREWLLEEATWFRLRNDALDPVQGRSQLEPPTPEVGDRAAVVEAAVRVVERFMVRVGSLSIQACEPGHDQDSLTADYRSLVASTVDEINSLGTGPEGGKPPVSTFLVQARNLINWRRERACGSDVPQATFHNVQFGTFRNSADSLLRQIAVGPPS